jgi:hypothetical protein
LGPLEELAWQVAIRRKLLPQANRGISAEFFFELAPACIQIVDRFLRCVQSRASILQTDPVARNSGILERRALGMEILFRFAYFPFHRSQFARFLIREFLPRRSGGFRLCARAAAVVR